MKNITSMKKIIFPVIVAMVVLYVALPQVQTVLESTAEQAVALAACGGCDGGGDPDGPDGAGSNLIPSCTLKIDGKASATIFKGDTVTVSIASTNANNTATQIKPTQTNISAKNGSSAQVTINNVNTTKLTVDVVSPDGVTRSCSADIVVQPLPVCTVTLSKTTITEGDPVTLAWTTANAGTVSVQRNGVEFSTQANHSGKALSLAAGTYKFEVKARKAGTDNAICPTTLTVNPPTPSIPVPGCTDSNAINFNPNATLDNDSCIFPAAPLASCTLSFSPNSVLTGETSSLRIITTNAVSAVVNQGVGAIALSNNEGAKTVTQTGVRSLSYTATVTNVDGKTATCAAALSTTAVPVVTLPTCTASFEQSSVVVGTVARLNVTTSEGQNSGEVAGASIISPITKTISLDVNGSGVRDDVVQNTLGAQVYTVKVITNTGESNTCLATLTTTAVPVPSCTIVATPHTIQEGGEISVQLVTTNASGASINGIGGVPTGTQVRTLPVAANFTGAAATRVLTVQGNVTGANGQTNKCTDTVTVTATPAPTCYLSFTPDSVVTGNDAVLNIATENAVSATVNQNIGPITVTNNAGTKTITQSGVQALTYTATVRNAANVAATCTAVLTTTPVPTGPTCVASFAPTSVRVNTPSHLTVTATPGVGTGAITGARIIAPTGLGDAISLDANNVGGRDITQDTVGTVEYTIEVTTSNYETGICKANLTTTPPPTPVPLCLDFRFEPESVVFGKPATLVLASRNAISAHIDQGVGPVNPNDSVEVQQDTLGSLTYTATLTNSAGVKTKCMADLTVTEPPAKIPTCTLTPDPATVSVGGSSIVTLTSYNAVSASVDQGIGDIAIDGSFTTTLTEAGDKIFTATVTNADGIDRTCYTTITAQSTPLPICKKATFSPSTITVGQASVLTVESENAVSASGNNGIGAVNPNGDTDFTPLIVGMVEYTITLTNADGAKTHCPAVLTATELPAPTCTLTADPLSVLVGGTSELTLASENAVEAEINRGVGSVMINSKKTVTLDEVGAKVFVATVKNNNGDIGSCQVTVTATPPPAPACTLTPGTQGIFEGESADITFSGTNFVSAVIDNNVGAVVEGQTVSVSPVTTTLFKGIVTSASGATSSCEANVGVLPVEVNPPRCLTFDASETNLPIGGGLVDFTWTTENASRVSIDNGVGEFTNGEVTTQFNVTGDTTFTLSAFDADGNVDDTSCVIPITVEKPVAPLPTCDAFDASVLNIQEGRDFELVWQTSNANSVSISLGNEVIGSDLGPDDRLVVEAPGTSRDVLITYTLTATNGTDEVTCPASITVNGSGGGGGGGGGGGSSSPPRCTFFRADDLSPEPGQAVTLSWDTIRANDLTLFAGDRDGVELFSSEDDDIVDRSEFVVRPDESTTYTLLLERGRRIGVCTVDIDFNEPESKVVVLESRDQAPRVAGIALTQVPYTGFEATPLVEVLFYLLLAAWGAFVAYAYILKRPQTANAVAVADDEEYKKKLKMLAAKYQAQNHQW